MDETCTYQIELRDPVDEGDLNRLSPIRMEVMQAEVQPKLGSRSMFVSIRSDQSGLIGLLRHLHARGLVLMSVYRESRSRA